MFAIINDTKVLNKDLRIKFIIEVKIDNGQISIAVEISPIREIIKDAIQNGIFIAIFIN